MQLVVVGIDHNSGPVSLRERLSVSTDALPGVLRELRENVAETFVLSTCNRVELYALCGHESSGADVLRQFLASRGDVPSRVIRESTYAHGHESAVRHVLRVAAGLESAVLGENEILGQVRRAIMAAREADALGPVLDRLGDSALACGKRTRASTALGGDGESVASVAVRLASRERGGLDGARVVILGAGDTARSALTALAAHANAHVTLINRTYERAVQLASEVGAEARPWSALASTLATADVVVGCTGSATPVLDVATVEAARRGNDASLICVDLGLPRDVAPAVGALSSVRLIGLDTIQREAESRRAERARDLARAGSIVEQETERYMEWWRGRGVASTIARLHARADAIQEAEVERALARLPEMNPHDRAVVRDLAARVIGKLLREPTLALKRDPEGVNMAVVVERLFGLGGGDELAAEHCALAESAVQDIHQESKVS